MMIEEAQETDEALFARFRDEADEGALRVLVERHWAAMYRLALAVVHEPATAEDVAQEACLCVVEAARRKSAIAPFSPWLRRVVVNEARDALRARGRREKHEVASAQLPRPVSAPADPGAALREYTERLPEKLGLPLVLHYGLGFTHEEVAETVGCRKGTAASRIRYALERLSGLAASGRLATSLVEIMGLAPVPSAPSLASVVARGAARPARGALLFGTRKLALVAAGGVVVVAASLAAALVLPETSRRSALSQENRALAPPSSDARPGERSAPAAARAPAPREVEGGALASTDAGSREKAAAIAARPTSPAVLAAIAALDDERVPPPYPWPAQPQGEGFLDREVSLSFEAVPFMEALEYLEELGFPRFTFTAKAREAVDQDEQRTTLRLKGISGRNALNLMCAFKDELVWIVDEHGVRVGVRDEDPELRAAKPAHVPFSEKRNIDGWVRDRGDWPWKYCDQRAALSKPISFDGDDTPLEDFVAFLRDLSGLDLRVSRAIDVDQVQVTIHAKERPLKDVLDMALRQTGLARCYRNETVQIAPREECELAIAEQLRRMPENRSLPQDDLDERVRGMLERGEFLGIPERLVDRKVSLDLRGINVSELRGELERQGIETQTTEEAWSSRGTFSLVVRDEPLGAVMSRLHLIAPVKALVPGSFLILHGAGAPSVREALTAELPPYPGAAERVLELREWLAFRLPLRARLRAQKDVDPAQLHTIELAVSQDAGRILSIIERAKAATLAPGEHEALSSRRERTNAELAQAKLALEAAKHARPDESYASERALAKPRNVVRRLEAELSSLDAEIAVVQAKLELLRSLRAGERMPEGQ